MLQPLQNYELEILKNLTQKAQAGQASQNELMIMKDYTDRYLAYNPQQQTMVQPQYNQPVMPPQYNVQPQYNQPMVSPQYNQQMLPPQYNVIPQSKYNMGQPFASFGNTVSAPTSQNTVNNGVFKYIDNNADTHDVYNQKQRQKEEDEAKALYAEQIRKQQEAQQQVVEVKKKPLIPVKGSELPWLVPPHYVLAIKEDEFSYEYEVKENNGVTKMNFRDHESIYHEKVINDDFTVNIDDQESILFLEDKTIQNIDDAIDHAMINSEINDSYTVKVLPYITVNPTVAKKVSTDEVSYLFADIILKSDGLISLAYNLKKLLDSKDEINKKATMKLDTLITNNIMLTLENVLKSNLTIDSFINDIQDLYEYINKEITDVSKRNRITTALLNTFNTIKTDNNLIYDLVADEETENKIGKTYFVEKITVVITNSDEVHYEINNLERNSLVGINNDITPVINDLIEKVKSKHNTFKTYIIDYKNGNVYLTMKNLVNKMNTVIRVK